MGDATKHVKRSRGGRCAGFEDVKTRRIDISNLRAAWPISGYQVMVDVEQGGTWLQSHFVGGRSDVANSSGYDV